MTLDVRLAMKLQREISTIIKNRFTNLNALETLEIASDIVMKVEEILEQK